MGDFGLGAVQSPPDERDFQIEELYAAAGVTPAPVLPPVYGVPNRPPILNQGQTPMCVAYSTSSMKSYQDRDDQAPAKFWNFDEAAFFKVIGGGPNGAVLRTALDRLLKVGYPVVGGASPTAAHKIAAYYAIPRNIAAIKAAIHTVGEIVLATPWYNSWFTPGADYILPRPDYTVGGHAIVADGWNDARGLRLRNSWGGAWGYQGDAFMPYAYVTSAVWELWKTTDT